MAIGQKVLPAAGEGDESSSLRYSQRNDPDSAPPPYQSSSTNTTFPPQQHHQRHSAPRMGATSSESAPLIAADVERDWYEEHRRAHQQGRRRRRLARIFIVVALLIVILVSMTTWSSSRGSNGNDDATQPPSPPSRDGSPQRRPDWSPPVKQPDYGRGGETHDWYSTVTNFTLDFKPDFDRLWLHAEGISYRGYLSVVADKRLKDGQASVGVETIFLNEEQRDRAVWVGKMRQTDKDVGLGIYGHRNGRWSSNTQVEVRILLFLPPTSTTPLLPPLEIRTDAISSSWEVGPEHSVMAKSLKYRSDAGSLSVGSISTRDSVAIRLGAGSVRPISWSPANITSRQVAVRLDAGSVTLSTLLATERAAIRTDAGSIRVHDVLSAPVAGIFSDAGSIEGTYEVIDELKVEASAGHIAINVKLPAGESKDGNGSHTARVKAHSDAGGVRVRYLEQDESVTLDSHATSSTGSVEVKHHPNFEGRFDLETSFGRLDVTPPTDGKREWLVESDRKGWTGRHVVGQVKGKKGNVGTAVCRADTGSVNAIF